MEQTLINILDKVQKLYQLRSVHHDQVQEELEIRRIASTVAHEEDITEIAHINQEDLKKFLDATSEELSMSAEFVSIACSVINMALHPVVKTGKRYLEAVSTIEKVKSVATTYEELKSGLIDENAKLEEELKLMGDLSSFLRGGQLVDMDIYIPFFKNILYADDLPNCLVAVTAIVRKNADLLERGEIEVEKPYHIFPEQASRVEQYENYLQECSSKYRKVRTETTDLYLGTLEEVVENNHLSLEEVKECLEAYPELYEYFLWIRMHALLMRSKRSSALYQSLEVMDEIEKIDSVYKTLFKKESIEELSKQEYQPKVLFYNTWIDSRVPTFSYQSIDKELYDLMEQLRQGRDVPEEGNITMYEGDVGVITGKTKYILFRKFPKGHTFLVNCGNIDQLQQVVTNDLVALIANSYMEMNNWILTNSKEYLSMVDISKAVETYLKNNIGGNE